MTNVYDELIVPHLQRMSNLEKLSLNLIIEVKNTFVDGIAVPNLNKFHDITGLVTNENFHP